MCDVRSKAKTKSQTDKQTTKELGYSIARPTTERGRPLLVGEHFTFFLKILWKNLLSVEIEIIKKKYQHRS